MEQSPCRGPSRQTADCHSERGAGVAGDSAPVCSFALNGDQPLSKRLRASDISARVGEGHVCHNTCGGQRTASGVGPYLLLCSRQGLIVIHQVYSRLSAAGSGSSLLLPSHRWSAGMTDGPHPCSRNSNPGRLACSATTPPSGLSPAHSRASTQVNCPEALEAISQQCPQKP